MNPRALSLMANVVNSATDLGWIGDNGTAHLWPAWANRLTCQPRLPAVAANPKYSIDRRTNARALRSNGPDEYVCQPWPTRARSILRVRTRLGNAAGGRSTTA